jgi:hypothetical protein
MHCAAANNIDSADEILELLVLPYEDIRNLASAETFQRLGSPKLNRNNVNDS